MDRKKQLFFLCELSSSGGVESVIVKILDMLRPNFDLFLISHMPIPDVIKNQIPFCSIVEVPQKPNKLLIHQYLRYKQRKLGLPNTVNNLVNDGDIVIDFKNAAFPELIAYLKSHKQIKAYTWLHCGMPLFKEIYPKKNWSVYDKIVVLTQSMKSNLIDEGYFDDSLISVIYNPFNFDEIKDKSLEKLQPTPQKKYFLSVGRLEKDKDWDTLIDAFYLFSKKNSHCNLLIIGDGSSKNELKLKIANLNLKNRVLLIGKKDNPFPFMKQASALILSSKSEGLPCVLIEGLACSDGIIISSDCPNGPAEILLDGKAGILFRPGDTTQLSLILDAIANNGVLLPNIKSYKILSLSRFTEKEFEKNFYKLIGFN